MTHLKKLFTLLLVVTVSIGVSGQDIHFSQFYMSPLNLNPALTGVNNCKNRFIVNYRNQWASVLKANAFNTYSVSYDQKTPVGRDDYFGIGGTLWGDVAGSSRFGTTSGKISGSYSKKIAGYRQKASYIVMGAELGVAQNRVDINGLLWPNQIDAGGINSNAPEQLNDTDLLYADIGAGLLYFSVLDKYTNYYIGAAAHHLNQPDVSFLGENVSLYGRYTVHAGGQFKLKPKVTLLPYVVMLWQGPHREFNGGTSFRFALGPSRTSNQSWQVGAWYRLGVAANTAPDPGTNIHSDAIIFSTRFNYEQFGIGFSYDLNVSELSGAANANGAFEFSLSYDLCGPENRGVYCPRF